MMPAARRPPLRQILWPALLLGLCGLILADRLGRGAPPPERPAPLSETTRACAALSALDHLVSTARQAPADDPIHQPRASAALDQLRDARRARLVTRAGPDCPHA